jgi:hypothetical protein
MKQIFGKALMNRLCYVTDSQTAQCRVQRQKYIEVNVMNLAATPNAAETSPINQQDPLQSSTPFRASARLSSHDVSHSRFRSAEITTVCPSVQSGTAQQAYRNVTCTHNNVTFRLYNKCYLHTQQCNIPSKQ